MLGAGIAGVVAFGTSMAWAAEVGSQDRASLEAAPLLEVVVVTAQKREERLQDVPLAVTAVTGAALAARQINDSNSLVAAVPSLTYTQGANPSNTSFRIRGVGTQLFGLDTEASVSVAVDGVVAARTAQGFAELADIERIEVLRGPQGTQGPARRMTGRPRARRGCSMNSARMRRAMSLTHVDTKGRATVSSRQPILERKASSILKRSTLTKSGLNSARRIACSA